MMEKLEEMITSNCYWFTMVQFAMSQSESISRPLMDRIHAVMMKDDGFGRYLLDPIIMERMWNKLQYRMDFRYVPIREIRDWVNDAFCRAVITGKQHNELMMRLAEKLNEREKRRKGWRDEIIDRHC